MAWIESHQGLAKHPKTLKLSRLLKVHIAQAVGHLHFLWWWALDYAQDGDLSKCDVEDIAVAANWPGDAEEFVSAMCDAGFLDRDESGKLSIHDWYEYAGRLIEKRAEDAERKRAERERKKQKKKDVQQTSKDRPEDVQRTSNGHPKDVQGTSSVTVPKPNYIDDDDDDIYASPRDEKFAAAYRTFEQHFGLLNPTQTQTLGEYIDAGMEPEVIEAAAQETRKRGFAADYFFGILENCITRGILTLQAFREDQMRFEKAKANKARASPEQKQPQPSGPVVPGVEETRRRIEELSKPVEGGDEIPPHVKERLRQIVRKRRHA